MLTSLCRLSVFSTFSLLLLHFVAAPALSVPITDILSGSDSNFSYSLIHTSSAGSDGQSGTILAGISLGANGGSITTAGGQLLIDAELVIDGTTYQAVGAFDLAGLLDDSVQADIMLGSLTLTGGTYAGVYFFEDRSYSSASLKPNSFDQATGILSLWGSTNVSDPNAKIGAPIDLFAASTGYGIDLRIEASSDPIPEPTSVALYLVGLAVVGGAIRKRIQAPSAA